MNKVKVRIVIKHSYPFFQDENLLKITIDKFPLKTDEIHITKTFAIIELKGKDDRGKVTIIFDKDIIQINFIETTDFSIINNLLEILPDNRDEKLDPSMILIEGILDKTSGTEDFNNLLKEENQKFKIKMLGIDYNSKRFEYKITSVSRETNLNLTFRLPINNKIGGISNIIDEINFILQEIYDEVLPSLTEFIGR
ncbi:hypothetical protein [Peribacillus frigoritolerans]|uniref:hypothetical protein n=1 Tax=Peribacillus frigoritolerans TaxID=450367 RepID=UPI002040585A|nr:hypothetical protein [Peribacillus frigoritolerans]MCM3167930.1 hypothetical protein [Peribacillus frigoritolerans]